MKASITTSFARAYKYGNVTAQAPEEVFNNITYPYNLGEFEKVINLSRFDVTYYKNDINQEHPVYILKNEYSNQNINLNGESVSTFYTNDKKSIDFVTREEYTDKIIGCGFGVSSDGVTPANHTSPKTAKTDEQDVDPEDRYNQVYYNQNQSRYTYFRNFSGMVPRAQYVYDNLFENGTIDGITPVYWPDDDSMIVPAVDIEKKKMCYYNNVGNKIYMREPMPIPGAYNVSSLTYGGANIYDYGWNGMFELLQDTQTNNGDTYLTFYPPVPFSNVGINSKMGYGTRPTSRRFDVKTIPIFLRDKNGEYWFWNITRLPSYVDYQYPQSGSFTVHSEYVVKVKDLPVAGIANGVISNTECVWITSEQFTDIGQVDRYLDAVFNPVLGPSYNDDGPDAIGPGDPYEDENNAGEAVGGDANIVDDITPPDMSPNTSYENYVIDNGLYGYYKLTTANLRNYTKTLQLCRDSAWMPGELGDKFENMGNLIQENTVSVFMLPVDIEDTTPVPFNVGTKAIRNSDKIGEWGQPSSVDTTNLINKYTKEYVYPLGTISHYYDNFLDFAPYSTASLYIPYIGKVEIPINLVQSTSTDQKQLSLSIRLNRTNGDILCILLSNNIPLCRWQGNCARSISLSVNDNSAILQNQFSRLVSSLSSFSSGLKALGAAATGNVGGATSNLGQMLTLPAPSVFSGAPIATSSHMIGNVPETGDVGWMDSQLITLTVERPIWWKPYDYGNLIGYPTRKIAKLSTVSGFAKVPNIHIRCSATESEKERLKAMLAEGVLF